MTEVSPGKQIHQYKFNNAIYGWISEKDAETGLYSMFVMKPQQPVQPVRTTEDVPARPQEGIENFQRDFVRRFRIDETMAEGSVEIKFTISIEGKITNIAAVPYNASIHEQVKEMLKDSEWTPAIENGKPVKSQFSWKIQIQHMNN